MQPATLGVFDSPQFYSLVFLLKGRDGVCSCFSMSFCDVAEGSHPRLTDTKKRCLSAFIPATNHKSAPTWDDLGVHLSKIVSDFHIYMEYPQLYVYIIYILVVSEPPFGWVALFEAARDRKSLAGSTWQLHRLLAGAVLDPNWNLLSYHCWVASAIYIHLWYAYTVIYIS